MTKRRDWGVLPGLGVFMAFSCLSAACVIKRLYPEALFFGSVAALGGAAALPLPEDDDG